MKGKIINKVIKLPQKLTGKPAINFIIKFRKKVTNDIKEVTLDAAELEFIDSGSIGFLIVEAIRLQRLGGSMNIKNLDEEIKENFLIANIEKIIKFQNITS
ncbi:MAG: STAS domain-containing protein [Chitinispirillia bacterium]|jgi:anti-anti-sigma factor